MNSLENKTPESEKSPEEKLQEFQQEVDSIVENEMARKKRGESYDAHFENIKAEHLGTKEREVWGKFKSGKLSLEDFEPEFMEAMEEVDNLFRAGKSGTDYYETKKNFWAFLNTELARQEAAKQLMELRKAKGQSTK